MKKLTIILLTILFAATLCTAQDEIIVNTAEITDSLALSDTASFSMGDSIVNYIMSDTLSNTFFVRSLVAAGGGGSATYGNFADSGIHIYHYLNNTQIIDFDASEITAGNTRTITMPDRDITLIDSADVETTTFVSLSAGDYNVGNHTINDETPGLEIEADGGDEYLHLWDASGSASLGATNQITLNVGVNDWEFTATDIVRNSTDSVAMLSDVAQTTEYVPGTLATADTAWIEVVTSGDPNFDGRDTTDFLPIIIDSTISELYSCKIDITSDNINDGDIITLIPDVESDEQILLTRILVFMTGSTAVTGSGSNEIYLDGVYSYETLTDGQMCLTTTGNQFWDQTVTLASVNFGANDYYLSSPITLDIYDGYSGTDRAGFIQVWYFIIKH